MADSKGILIHSYEKSILLGNDELYSLDLYCPFFFFRYDLLFGVSEIESYNSINAIGIMHGLLER